MLSVGRATMSIEAQNVAAGASAIRQLQREKAAAGDKNVVVGGGANTAQQFIRAESIDELQIHLVPVLLGEGLRLFDYIGGKPVKLEKTSVVDAPDVTHYREDRVRMKNGCT